MNLDETVREAFNARFKSQPDVLVHAPGRVNLIGEHTDYNDGFVLPCAIDFGTTIAARRRDDDIITVSALDYDGQTSTFSVEDPIKPDDVYPWSNYIRGVAHIMARQGHSLAGVDMVVTGNVPQGAGLSSSASLEVAVALTLSTLFDLRLNPVELAQIGQAAENDFVGCQCGIMDQLASATGQSGHATLIDCRTLSVEPVVLPDGVSIVIANSNVRRGLVDSEYNTRRAECQSAANALGVAALRDATMADLEKIGATLAPSVYRRARHVITENERTLAAAEALQKSELQTLRALMSASHRSLKTDFEVTVRPLDVLVELVDGALDGDGGCRMTGGGFGGCVVALVPSTRVSEVVTAIETHYENETGLTADIFVCQPSAGARVLEQRTFSAIDE